MTDTLTTLSNTPDQNPLHQEPQHQESRFLSRSRIKTIFMLAVPILATMLSANLMGVIDTAMIGQLGDSALASVSVGSNLFFMTFSLIMGVSAGVQILVARRMGQGDGIGAPAILNAGLVAGLVGGLVLIVVGYLVLPFAAGFVNSDPVVIAYARDYLIAVLPAILFGGLSMAFSGYWLGIHKPHLNFITVIVQLGCNAFFNYLLIFGNFGLPRLEVLGAGMGTSLANLVALLVNIIIMFFVLGRGQLLHKFPDRAQFKTLLTFSIPMGLQQFLISLGMMVFVYIVGLLGTKPLAAFQIVLVIMMTSFMLAIGLGTTATTLISSALGKKDYNSAAQWGWEISTLGAGILLMFGLIFFIFSENIVDTFTIDPETAALALLPLRIMIISVWLEAFGRILSMALMGAGAIGTVFKINFLNQWFLRLPSYWLVGIVFEQGLVGIFITMLILYIVQTSFFVVIWRRGKWAEIDA